MNKVILSMILASCWAVTGAAALHYVSPTGTGNWNNSLNMSSPSSLDTANASAIAGDIVCLRSGTYNTHICPANSGTKKQVITYQNYTGEKPVIINTATAFTTYFHGIILDNRSYIKISGITIGPDKSNKMNRLFEIVNKSSHNEIDSCSFYGNFNSECINIWKGSTSLDDTCACTHNWLHNCVFANNMRVHVRGKAASEDMSMQVGIPTYDSVSGYNTIESNTFYCGGHHNMEVFSTHNVIRNNFMHQAPGVSNTCGTAGTYPPDSNGRYGHRNIQIYDGGNHEGMYNVIEGNRFGPALQPPEDDGGDGFTLTAPKNIVRYNVIYNSQNNGLLLKTGFQSLADNNRIYNNTIFHNGRYKPAGVTLWQGFNFRWYGGYARKGNIILNNILYGYGPGGADWGHGNATIYTDNIVRNNWGTDPAPGRCIGSGDPKFVDPSLPGIDEPQTRSRPNLALQKNSPVINLGTNLTVVARDDTGSGATLIVDDALFFQAGSAAATSPVGSSLSGVQGDWIAVGTVGNIAQITDINYAARTITLNKGIRRGKGQPVWLYQKSDGARVLYGTAPDLGAEAYSGTSDR